MTSILQAQRGPTPRTGRSQLATLGPILVRDIGIPTGAYYALHALGASDWLALAAGAVVSAALVVVEAVRARRLDVFSGFMLGVFAFGLVMTFVSGDPRFMIVKDSFGTAVVGTAFLGSCLLGKPLTYLAARRATAADQQAAARFEQSYRSNPAMRETMSKLSALWGVGLLAEAGVRVWLAYQLPVSTMVWLSTVLMLGTIAVISAASMGIARTARRRAAVTAAPAAA